MKKKNTIDITKAYCRVCKQQTNHQIQGKLTRKNIVVFGDYEDQVIEWYTYKTLQCKGCETVCLREIYECTEDYDPDLEQIIPTITDYPEFKIERLKLTEATYIPKDIRNVYEETIDAYNAKLLTLTSIGIRTIIEGVCKNYAIKTGGLKNKIDKLIDKKLITPIQAELLHLNRNMGNASAHELSIPNSIELDTGIEIIESLLSNAFILPGKGRLLKKIKNG